MEERTGCFVIGQQPVFKKACINLHISISTRCHEKKEKSMCCDISKTT
jgi:hypothetical protein